MSALDDLETIVLLACEIDDRTAQEQRALLRIAVNVERERNARTVRNRRQGDACRLVDVVEQGQRVVLSASVRAHVEQRRARWLEPDAVGDRSDEQQREDASQQGV